MSKLSDLFSNHTDVVRRLLEDTRVFNSVNHIQFISYATKNYNLNIINMLLMCPGIQQKIYLLDTKSCTSAMGIAVTEGYTAVIARLAEVVHFSPHTLMYLIEHAHSNEQEEMVALLKSLLVLNKMHATPHHSEL